MILYADVGGTNVRMWAAGEGKKVDQLVVGLRGAWTSAEKKAWRKRFRGIAPQITVLSDIELAHRLAFGREPGIVVNAGTGSIAFGKNKRGKTARAGGLGPLIGDEGSAFWIGREYLRLLYQMDPRVEKVRSYVVGPNAVAKIAALAKNVLKTAGRKPNSYEARIADQAAFHLRELVHEVCNKLNLPASTPIHVTGGLFESDVFRRLWQTSLSRS